MDTSFRDSQEPSVAGPGEAEGSRESDAKRRKIRKGTRSCWECKRRKIRCVFDDENPGEDAICVGCQRRGTTCISQEFPEEPSESRAGRGRQMGDRIVRVEALVEQLVRKVGHAPDGGNGRGERRAVARGAWTSARTTASGSPADASGSIGGDRVTGSMDLLTPDDSGSESARGLFKAFSKNSRLIDGLEHESLTGSEASTTPSTRTPSETPASFVSLTSSAGRFAKLSQTLHAALPSLEDAIAIANIGGGVALHLKQVILKPYQYLADGGWDSPEMVAQMPDATAHPALLAKKLLHFSVILQFCAPQDFEEMRLKSFHGLSQSEAMARMVEPATSLVTTNDELIGSITGLECVLLEAVFHGNTGNLRRGWLTIRRAMVLAQLMGLHKGQANRPPLRVLEPQQHPIFPAHVWFRIVFMDRYMSLMLGLPQGSLDTSMANEAALANDTAMGRLERLSTVIASRIVERNETNGSLAESLATTHQIDLELQRVATVVPAKWWLVPPLTQLVHDPEGLFYATLCLLNQIFHYTMLIHLHLPYMLSSPRVAGPKSGDGAADAAAFQREHHSKFEYSKLTSVNASREVLARFIVFRSINHVAYCCRSADFAALTASMTLLVAHLDNHSATAKMQQEARQQRPADGNSNNTPNSIGSGGNVVHLNYATNFLAHSRLSDRAMMEQVLESMDDVARVSADVVSRKSSELLRRLLEMEAEAAAGTAGFTTVADDDGRRAPHLGLPEPVDADAEGEDDREGLISINGNPIAELEPAPGAEPGSAFDPGVLRMYIPYFGTVKIAREGTISKEVLPADGNGNAEYVDVSSTAPLPTNAMLGQEQMQPSLYPAFNPDAFPPHQQQRQASELMGGLSLANTQAKGSPFSADLTPELLCGTPLCDQSQQQQQQQTPQNNTGSQFAEGGMANVSSLGYGNMGDGAHSSSLLAETVRQNLNYPGLTANIDDWAFQGVDVAFFDSLMRGTQAPAPASAPNAELGEGTAGSWW